MKKLSTESGSSSLWGTFWNLVIIGLFGVLVYLLYTQGYLDKYLERFKLAAAAASASPTPPTKEPSLQPAPAPAVVAASTPEPMPETTPMPTQQAASTPAPVPNISLANLDRRFWPKQVKLLKPTQFPIISNGHQIGMASAPAGMAIAVVDIHGDQVEVQNGGMIKSIASVDTDILDRVRVLMRVANNTADSGAAAPAPVAEGTPWRPMLQTVH